MDLERETEFVLFQFHCIGQFTISLFLSRGKGLGGDLLLSRHAGIFLCLIYSVRYVGIIIETFLLSEHIKGLL